MRSGRVPPFLPEPDLLRPPKGAFFFPSRSGAGARRPGPCAALLGVLRLRSWPPGRECAFLGCAAQRLLEGRRWPPWAGLLGPRVGPAFSGGPVGLLGCSCLAAPAWACSCALAACGRGRLFRAGWPCLLAGIGVLPPLRLLFFLPGLRSALGLASCRLVRIPVPFRFVCRVTCGAGPFAAAACRRRPAGRLFIFIDWIVGFSCQLPQRKGATAVPASAASVAEALRPRAAPKGPAKNVQIQIKSLLSVFSGQDVKFEGAAAGNFAQFPLPPFPSMRPYRSADMSPFLPGKGLGPLCRARAIWL